MKDYKFKLTPSTKDIFIKRFKKLLVQTGCVRFQYATKFSNSTGLIDRVIIAEYPEFDIFCSDQAICIKRTNDSTIMIPFNKEVKVKFAPDQIRYYVIHDIGAKLYTFRIDNGIEEGYKQLNKERADTLNSKVYN